MIEPLLSLKSSDTKFRLGVLRFTVGAYTTVPFEDIAAALARHAAGDWGDLVDEDREENEFSLHKYLRLLSVYHDRYAVKFWIITEADRESTTVLLPEEY